MIFIFLNNCQKADLKLGNTNTEVDGTSFVISTTVISMHSLFKENETVRDKLSKIGFGTNSQNRGIESNLGFTIDTSRVIKIQTDSYDSYSFQTQRDTDTPNYLENYIITYYSDGSYVQHLINYPILSEGSYDIKSANIETINDSSLVYMRGSCITVAEFVPGVCIETPCGDPGGAQHPYWYGSECFYWETPLAATRTCTEAGYIDSQYCSTGGPEGGGPNTGGNPGAGSGNPTPIVVVPVTNTKTPCEKMNALKFDTGFRAKMLELKNAAANENLEKGYSLYNKRSTPGSTDRFLFVPASGLPNKPEINYSYSTSTQGWVHTHYNGLISVFSVKDLYEMYITMKNGLVTDDFVYGLITHAGTAYFLQIQDRAGFIAFGDRFLSNDDKRYKYTQNLQENYDVSVDSSIQDNEKGFVEMLHKLNVGLTMFKPTDLNFTDYVKLEYDRNGTLKTNCQ